MVLADLSIKRPVMMTMVIMTFVVIGIFSLGRLGIDLMPKMDFPFISVMTIYPGAGPEEIETLINKPLEEEVSAVSGVKNLYSISQEGVSIILVELQLEEDVDMRAIDVKDKIDAIRMELPEDIEEPVVQKFEMGSEPIINLAVTGPYPLEDIYVQVDKVIKPELSKISGLASVDITGSKEREIRVTVSNRQLRAYGLSPLQIVGALAQANITLPSGRIEAGRKEYTLRVDGEYNTVEQIANTRIQTPVGMVPLNRIAEVTDSFEERRELAWFNGVETIGLDLVKQSDANTVQIAADAYAALERIRGMLPEGMKIEIANDTSDFIRNSVADVSSNLVLGILFTAVVLFMFLHSWRGTVIAAVAMPTSIVSTFILLDAAGFTLNIMSLMGLSISVGILVVNAIVVLENIERLRIKEGLEAKEAASVGTQQVTVAVAASTLTNIVVFTPMAFMAGIIGPIFRQFGLTVAFATIFSLLVSFTLTPMMASRKMKAQLYVIAALVMLIAVYVFLSPMATVITAVIVLLLAVAERMGGVARFSKFWDKWYGELEADYRAGLEWALKHRLLIMIGTVVLFVGGLSLFGFIGSEFFPSSDQRMFRVSVEMPAGTRMEETNAVLSRIEKEVAKFPEVQKIYTALGSSNSGGFGGSQGVQTGSVLVNLADTEEAPEGEVYPHTSEVLKELRPMLADIPAAEIVLAERSMMGGGEQSDIELQLLGDDIDDLVRAAEKAIQLIQETGKAVDVRSDWEVGKPEVAVYPDRARLRDVGANVMDIAMTLRTLYEGNVATKFREGGDEFDVRVKLDSLDRNQIDRVGDLLIPTLNGFVPLKELAEVRYTSGPTQLTRKNKQRLVTVYANVASGTAGELQSLIAQQIELPPVPASQQIRDILSGTSSVGPRPSPMLPKGVTAYFGGQAEMMAESFSSMFQALVLAIILTYMLLSAILESYRFPFIIMTTLPLGLVGVSMALVMTGKAISMISLMAIIMLVGIVVNNGILLLDYTVQLRQRGRGLLEAILEACPIRLRPILMATTATSLGMLPLALGIGKGGDFRSSMAIVAIGGLIVSTAMALFLIPVLYAVFEARGERKRLEAEEAETEEAETEEAETETV